MGIITAEALYPSGYSTSQNEISDLGATEPPDSVIEQPSATIFNTTMIVCGVLVLAASVWIQRGFGRKAAPILIALFGLGVLGVGIFPGDYGTVHAIFALLTFVAGGVAAIVSYTLATSPFRYFSIVLGAVALAMLLLYMIMGDSSPVARTGHRRRGALGGLSHPYVDHRPRRSPDGPGTLRIRGRQGAFPDSRPH